MTILKEGMFYGLPMLKALYIDNNKIAIIEDDAFSGIEGVVN